MQFSAIVAALFATSVAAVPFELQERQCVGNLGQCDKGHVPGFKNCCDGLYCCGVIGSNNVCQTVNNCGE